LNSGVFNTCSKYKLKDNTGGYTKLTVASSTTSLNSAFRGTSITWEELKQIINTIIPNTNSIRNVAYMFAYCDALAFGQTELKNSITNDDYPSFNKLSKVTDASYFFYSSNNSGVNALNKKFMQMGATSGCNYS
jgi:hypothetical protein